MFKFAKHNNKNKKTTIMKKSIALVAMAFGVTSAFAQDLTSKKGEPFLPEAGDWAVSIDANPFFSYAKGLIGAGSNAGTTSPSWGSQTNTGVFGNLGARNYMTITGKMFKDANTAYRATVGLGFTSTKITNQTGDRTPGATAAQFPTVPTMKENVGKTSSFDLGLSVGIEKRRGKTRLQGFYGAEAGLGLGSTSSKYTYGNALVASTTGSANVVVDVTGDDVDGSNITTDTYGNDARVTVRKSGLALAFGVRGFVGAEYFLFPKISVGGEFGWGLGLGMSGKSKYTTESHDSGLNTASGDPAVGTQDMEGSSRWSVFGVNTDKNTGMFGPSGTIRLNLHF